MIDIRKFTEKEMKGLSRLQPEGWPDIRVCFNLYIQSSFCHPLAAIDGDQLVGTGTAIYGGKTGWIAHIIVIPEYRGHGLGQQLTNKSKEILKEKGCATISLIATDLGKPVYEKTGFKVDCWYNFFQKDSLPDKHLLENIGTITDSDMDDILELDKKITGEDRSRMIKAFPFSGYLVKEHGIVKGYYLDKFEEGPVIASDSVSGISLLSQKHSNGIQKAVFPEDNKSALRFFEDNGFKLINKAARMYCGEKLTYSPDGIYSRTGGFYG